MQTSSDSVVLHNSIKSLKEGINSAKVLSERKDAGHTKQWTRNVVQAGKTIFYHLGTLNKALNTSDQAAIRGLGQSCLDCLLALFSTKTVEITAPYQEMISQCLTTLFLRSETLNLRSVVMDLHQILEKNKSPPSTRICAALCLGSLCEVLGHKMQAVLKETLDAFHRAAKSAEKGLREGCMVGMKGILEGCGDGGLFTDFFRILQRAFQDRMSTPAVRSNALTCLPYLLGPKSAMLQHDQQSLLLQLCCRGLEDEVMMVRLAGGKALGTLLAQSIQQGERERAERSVRAARGEDQPQSQGSDPEGSASGPHQGFDKALTKLKELNANLKVDSHHKGKQAAEPFALQSAVQYLCALMWRNPSEEWRATCATALVTLLQSQQDKLDQDSISWLINLILELLEESKISQVQDQTALRAAVSYVLRDGIGTDGSEQLHQLLCARLTEFLSTNDCNEHQLQVALSELGHLTSALGEACAVFMEPLSDCLRKLIASPKYGVRFEAAHVMASLANSRPESTALLLSQMLAEVEMQSAALIALCKTSSENKTDEQRKEKATEMRTRMYGLHGAATCCSALLASTPKDQGSSRALPQPLLAHTVSLAERLVSLQFAGSALSPGIICTNVRAGWTLVVALISHGPTWVKQYINKITNWWKQVIHSCRQGSDCPGFEATHQLVCLDAALASILCFLKNSQQLICVFEGLLGELVGLLGGAFMALKYNLEAPAAAQGAFRHNLIKAELMECYAWLPPGCFAEISDELFDWAMEHIRTLVTEGIATSLLPDLLNPTDALLQTSSCFSPPSLAPGANLAGGMLTDDIVATEVQLMGMPLGHLERDAMLCAGLLSDWCDQSHVKSIQPLTLLHGAHWRKPPPPPTYMKARLLDAAIFIFSSTFGYQSDESQLTAVGMLISLLPSSMRPGAKEKPNIKDVMASEEEKRKREHRSLQSAHNVATTILCCLRLLPSYREQSSDEGSVLVVEMPWAAKARELLVGLLGINSAGIRQAAAAGLGEMGLKLGSGFTANLAQLLLGRLSTHQVGRKKGAALDLKGEVKAAAAEAAGRKLATVLFSFACLRRANGNDIELTWIWGEFHRHLTAPDLAPNAKAWGIYSLSVLLNTIKNPQEIEEKELKQMLTSVMELVELHYLGPSYDTDDPVALQAILKLISSTFPLLRRAPSLRSPAFNRFATIWGVLCRHRDLRVRTETLRLLAVGCAHCSDLMQAFDAVLLGAVAKGLEEKGSPDTIIAALDVLKVANSNSFDLIFSHRRALCIEIFRLLESVVSSSFWLHAPFWRAVNIGRTTVRFYHKKSQLQSHSRDLLYQLCEKGSKAKGSAELRDIEVDCLLMARAFFLVTGSKKQEPMALENQKEQDGNSADAQEGSEHPVNGDEEKETAPRIEDQFSDWRSYLIYKRKMVNQDVFHRMGALRWQIKSFAVSMTNKVLNNLSKSEEAIDILQARQIMNEAIGEKKGEFQLNQVPDDISLHLEDLIAVTSASTAACVGDFDLPTLQKEGAHLLGYIFEKFGGMKDPDISSEQSESSILEQSMSQLNICLRTTLNAKDRPLLTMLGCKILLASVQANLITDHIVVRRFLKLVLPSEWNSSEVDTSHLNLDDSRPAPSLVYNRQLVVSECVVRLAALAKLFLETQAPNCALGVSEGVTQSISPHMARLTTSWMALVQDLVRVKQGEGVWPSANKSKCSGWLIDQELAGPECKQLIGSNALPCLTALCHCLASETTVTENRKEDYRFLFLVCHGLLLEYCLEEENNEKGLMILTAFGHLLRSPYMAAGAIPLRSVSACLKDFSELTKRDHVVCEKAVELIQQILRQDGVIQTLCKGQPEEAQQELWHSVLGVFLTLLKTKAPELLEENKDSMFSSFEHSTALVQVLLMGALMIPLDPDKEQGTFCLSLLGTSTTILQASLNQQESLNLLRALAIVFQEAVKFQLDVLYLGPVMDAVTSILAATLKTSIGEKDHPQIQILIQIWVSLLCSFDQFCPHWFQPLQESMMCCSKEANRMLVGSLNQSIQAYVSTNSKVAQSILCYMCPTTLISLTRSIKMLKTDSHDQLPQLIAENIKLILLSYKLANPESKGKVVELILPEFVQVLKVQDPLLSTLTGQSLLHIARESALAFKTTVQALIDEDRQLLQQSLQATMQGSSSAVQKAKGKSDKKPTKRIDLRLYRKS